MREPDPFAEAIAALYRPAMQFAYRLAGTADKAEDLVQTAIMRALTSRHTWTGDRSLSGNGIKAWLFTIIKNEHLTNHRRHWRMVEDPDDAWALSMMDEGTADPEEKLLAKEVCEALARLPAKQQQALIATQIDGDSYEEAAAKLGTCVGTIKSRVNRARDHIERDLAVENPKLRRTDTVELTEGRPAGPSAKRMFFSDEIIHAVRLDTRSSSQIARDLGVSAALISQIKHRKAYKHVQ